MGVGAAGLVVIEIIGVLNFIGRNPFSCGQLPKTNDL